MAKRKKKKRAFIVIQYVIPEPFFNAFFVSVWFYFAKDVSPNWAPLSTEFLQVDFGFLFLPSIHVFISRPESLLPQVGFLSCCGGGCYSWASHGGGSSHCKTQVWGTSASVAAAWRLASCGSKPRWLAHGLSCFMRVGSPHSGDQTCVPCVGRWIVNHWTTGEAPQVNLIV